MTVGPAAQAGTMGVIEVLPTLRMLRFPVGAAYLWPDGDELTLIDTGTADCAARIEQALDGELRRIVLTHCHQDHTGSAAELAAGHGAEVVSHRLEAPVIQGRAAGAPVVLEEFEVPIMAALPPLPPAPPCRVDREVGVFNTDRTRAVASLHRLAELEAETAVFRARRPDRPGAAAALREAAAAAR
jgi:glyoxylase-like metal-dependent hydrolase (beta-lactamase superfamily II)